MPRAELARRHDAREGIGVAFETRLRRSLHAFLEIGRRDKSSALLARALNEVFASTKRRALDDALRILDRAWRIHASSGLTLAPIYGQLLMLAAQDDHAALHMLRHAGDLTPHPDLDASTVLALLRLGRYEDALTTLQRALSRYCIRPGDLLARTARYAALHPKIAANGWAARGLRLELVGELATLAERPVLTLECDGQSSPIEVKTSGRHHAFKWQVPENQVSKFQLTANATPLRLGGVQRGSIDFGLDGRSHDLGGRVSGWVRLDWSPQMRLAVRGRDESGHSVDAAIDPFVLPGGRWRFCIDRRAASLRGNRVELSAHLPDGRWQPLPDSPLLLRSGVRRARRDPAALREWRTATTMPPRRRAAKQAARPIDVIIPVFRGREETLACIQSVRATIDDTVHVVVIDDASDDEQLVKILREMAARGHIELLTNTKNRGFVGTANRGLALHRSHDVVLLNSDTVVFGDWLARLQSAAYSAATVGTVTPWSNSGSIASYPQVRGTVVDVDTAALIDARAAAMKAVTARIPVGVGFCLYIRRDCLDQVGVLDENLFGTGYGEETDFCLRALKVGWSHLLAANVFVYHAGGISFGRRREALVQRSQRLINLRHPGYERRIRAFFEQDPLHSIRRNLDETRVAEFSGRFVLLVSSPLGGGVSRFVTERGRALHSRGFFPLVLRAVAGGNSRSVELWTDALLVPNLRYEMPRELPRLAAFLKQSRLHAAEIHHFLYLKSQIIEVVRALGIPYDVFVHDYVWICPRVTLIGGTGQYCGEPPVSVCRTCVRQNGSRLGEKLSVTALRRRSARWLKGASQVIAPSEDTAERLRRHFPDLPVEVRPHSASFTSKATSPSHPARKMKRIALIGAIGTHKGYRVLLACARDARKRRLPMQFVVIGYTENDTALMATGKVFVTGEYGEAEVPHLLSREQPDVVWLPSVWPETWCYALDHALASARPVVAFDVGAIAERLRSTGVGELLPLNLEPRLINNRLLKIAQAGLLPSQDLVKISGTNEKERRPMNAPTQLSAALSREGELSASLQVLPLPAGLYLFSVKTGGPPTVPGKGNALSLPALHVGLGPGVSAQQIEFMAGPSTQGAWLYTTTDVLVAKVNADGAALVLTSVRGPGGEVLSIVVERLENRAEATAAAAAASLAPQARPTSAPIGGESVIPLQVTAHIATRGDVTFTNTPWAGRAAPGLWIESFAIRPLEHLAAQDIEYKALTGNGFETPWLSDNMMCGTRGMRTPLIGFAIRLRSGPAAVGYDCEYSGYFKSGATVGPVRDGAPCRSSVANDSLEGIQLRLIKRTITRSVARTNTSSVATVPERKSVTRARSKVPAAQRRSRRTPSSRR